MSIREDILKAATRHTVGDRDIEYGPPHINLGDQADLWTTYLICRYRGTILDENQFHLTPEDAAQMMVLSKMARTFSGKVKLDTFEDQTAYSAIAGECATILAEEKGE